MNYAIFTATPVTKAKHLLPGNQGRLGILLPHDASPVDEVVVEQYPRSTGVVGPRR